MKIRKLTIEGRPGREATIRRRAHEIRAFLSSDGEEIACDARDYEGVWRLARELHRLLEGFEGTEGDVEDIHILLTHFAD